MSQHHETMLAFIRRAMLELIGFILLTTMLELKITDSLEFSHRKGFCIVIYESPKLTQT